MAKAYIIASVRTAVGRAYKGSLKDTRPDDLGAAAIRARYDGERFVRVVEAPPRLSDVAFTNDCLISVHAGGPGRVS